MTSTNASQHAKRIAKTTVILSILSLVGVAAAQNTGSSFCSTDMAATIQNIIRVLIYGGPLIGGTIFIGSVIGIPIANRSDWKKRLKEKRNQALIWGVIVAPLASRILAFIINNIVEGAQSCGF